MDDPLAALRPLHEPPPIPWWPPAPGWWLLVLLILVGVVLALWWWRSKMLQRAALRELKALEPLSGKPVEQVSAVNRLLKRYALVCWEGREVAALTGEAWLKFLDRHGGDGGFTRGPGRSLATLSYGDRVSYTDGLFPLARRWIKANKPVRKA